MFYPGAVTFCAARIFVGFGTLVVMAILQWFVLLGHKMGKEPITGWRQQAIIFINRYFVLINQYACFINIKVNYVDYDYSEYLGKDYLKTQ
jgi:fucose permease